MGCSSNSFIADNPQADYSLFTREQHQLLDKSTQSVLKALIPVTLPTYDSEGSIIQIWQYHKLFLGAILDKNGCITTVPSSHIHNGLQPHESGDSFLHRIASLHLRKWELIVLPNQHIAVWPYLEAAGRPGPDLHQQYLKRILVMYSEKVQREVMYTKTQKNIEIYSYR
ncbi:MAG: hypothetical protein C5B45_01750 [Chlamydiae bacterium]|nr:MAG: hypothetical protein C5B45_01750 [Chlamydiota bacterium]